MENINSFKYNFELLRNNVANIEDLNIETHFESTRRTDMIHYNGDEKFKATLWEYLPTGW